MQIRCINFKIVIRYNDKISKDIIYIRISSILFQNFRTKQTFTKLSQSTDRLRDTNPFGFLGKYFKQDHRTRNSN